MPEENKVCQILGIKYPIIQRGIAGISESKLASAVSNAGGLGVIASGLEPSSWLREEIERTKKMTQNPFGVDILVFHPDIERIIEIIIQMQVPVVFTEGGNPLLLFPYFEAAGIKIIPIVPSPRLAKKMEENGADAVVVEGFEAINCLSQNTTFSLIYQTKNLLKIPLIASGGIFDPKMAKAAFFLGADGISMGTRFLASKECIISDAYKEKIIKATADDLEVILKFTRFPLRVIKNKWSEKMKKLEERNAFPEEIDFKKILKLLLEKEIEDIPLLSGLSAAGISEIKSSKEIVEEIASALL